MKDREITSLLHSLNRPTFFSLDHGLFKRELCHQAYCLVHLTVEEERAAEFIRRAPRHHQLNSWVNRRSGVLRLRPRGISANALAFSSDVFSFAIFVSSNLKYLHQKTAVILGGLLAQIFRRFFPFVTGSLTGLGSRISNLIWITS